MNSKKMNDKELQELLQKYQPLPPEASPYFLQHTIQKLGLKERSFNQSIIWMTLGSGLVTSLLLFAFMNNQFEVKFKPQPILSSSAKLNTSSIEDDESYVSGMDMPTLNVGEDYLMLVSR